jgi:hypothetical protein
MVRSVLVTLVVSAAAAAVADAQQAHDRSGLWAGVGLGVGSARASCSVCAGRATGPAAHARLGGTISRKLLVGVQGIGWFDVAGASDRTLLMLAAVGTLYPWPDKGLYLEAGIGGYRYVEADTANELSTQGLALHVGAGFDVRITRGVSLSPFAILVSSGSGNPTRLDKSSGTLLPLLSDMTVRYFQLGVAATFH